MFKRAAKLGAVEFAGFVVFHVLAKFISVLFVLRNFSSLMMNSLNSAFAVPAAGGVVRKLLPKPSRENRIFLGNNLA